MSFTNLHGRGALAGWLTWRALCWYEHDVCGGTALRGRALVADAGFYPSAVAGVAAVELEGAAIGQREGLGVSQRRGDVGYSREVVQGGRRLSRGAVAAACPVSAGDAWAVALGAEADEPGPKWK